MATVYVDKVAGDDTTGDGTQAKPARTATKGESLAVRGDTIVVAPTGTYNEQVTPTKSDLTFISGPGPKAVFDGGGTLGFGFYSVNSAVKRCRFEGFEIRNYTSAGVKMQVSTKGVDSGTVIANNHIHHIMSPASDPARWCYGVYCAYGNTQALNNEIHDIGQGGESTGIWMGYSHNFRIDGNVIYKVRKEGLRDYFGLNGQVTSNRTFLCWTGLSTNENAGTLVANNASYMNAIGIDPKHSNDPYQPSQPGDPTNSVLYYWGKVEGEVEWTRIWHNTFWRNSYAGMVLAINGNQSPLINGLMNQVDIRNNIIGGWGGEYIWDSPYARTDNIVVDYNLYDTQGKPPAYVYAVKYTYGALTKTLAELQGDTTLNGETRTHHWETHGQQVDAQLVDPDHGDFSYPGTSPAATMGATPTNHLDGAPSPWGSQMGAKNLPAAPATYSVVSPVTALSAKSTSPDNRQRTVDELQERYHLTNSPTDEWWIYDLGAGATYNTMVLDIFSHQLPYNPKLISLDVADDPAGPWTEVYRFTNPDSYGSSYKYELPATYTNRYARFWARTNFGNPSYTVVADVRFGLLTAAGNVPDPTPVVDTTAPTVSLTAPAAGNVSGNVTITATASDNVAVDRVEFYVGATKVGSAQASPYSVVWATTPADAGAKVITAKAYDAAGNSATSAAVNVTVTTAAPPPPATQGEYWGMVAS